jgi:hypothetical protein
MADRVVVVVEGGAVQSIATDDPETHVFLIDWDNIKQMEWQDMADFREEIRIALEVDGSEEVRRFLMEAAKRLAEEMKARR